MQTVIAAPGFSATRAQKNLRWLRVHAPEVFVGKEPDSGWESVIPASVLSQLHHSIPRDFHGPLDVTRLSRVAFPSIRAALTEPVFTGTIVFAQIRFSIQSPPGSAAVPLADVQTAVEYATKAARPLVAYTNQYGATSMAISQSVVTHDVTLATATYSDADLQGWVNDMA